MSIALAARSVGVSAIAGLVIPALIGVARSEETKHSARDMMEKMEPGERYAYVAGIVEGIAFYRYTAGNKNADAMSVSYDRIGVAWAKDDGSLYIRLHGTQIVADGFALYPIEDGGAR